MGGFRSRGERVGMTVSTLPLPGYIEQWPNACPACGQYPACGVWLAATAKEGRDVHGCELYPCACVDRPAYFATCWWRDDRGRVRSKCDCWGRRRDDRLPDDCCAFDEHNPLYRAAEVPKPTEPLSGPASFTPVDMPDDLPPADVAGAPDLWAGFGPMADDEVSDVGVFDEPEVNEFGDHARSQWQPPPTVVVAPYVRRWAPDEVTCPCPTPWDKEKRSTGYHCVQCHLNFANERTAQIHQRWWRDPCRRPAEVVDVDTGKPLLAARPAMVVDADGRTHSAMVWHLAWGS